MKLHLGCGNRYLPGFFHIDAINYDGHIDYVGDIAKLNFIETNSVEEIYASHVLEHFKRHQIEEVLNEWNRVLQINGILRIAVPNFEAIVNHYNQHKDISKLIGLLYVGQTYDYNFHHVCFDFISLKELLEKSNYKSVKEYDWRTFLPDTFDDYSKSYLPHLDFENGTLMSLNIIAEKK